MKLLPLLLLLVAASALAEPAPARKSVSIDIYNRDLAMVRDTRIVSLDKGDQTVDFTGISTGIFGHTAAISLPGNEKKVESTQLSFNYDLLNHDKLIRRYIGQWISFSKEDETYNGRLLAIDDKNIFLQPDTTDKLIQVIDRGELVEMFYPELPEGLYVEPTLRWSVKSKDRLKEVPVEISYLTTGITWMCDYRGELLNDTTLSLSATMTIANDLAEEFQAENVSFMVGKPHQSDDPAGTSGGDEVSKPGAKNTSKPGAMPERVGEVYLFDVANINLKGPQTLQIPWSESRKINVKRRYFFPHLLDDQTVADQIVFDAGFVEGGILPEGDIGLYRRDKGGLLRFVGQDFIPITPPGGRVEITVGQAIDITAKRRRLAQNRPARDTSEETWLVEVTNGKKEPVTLWAEQRAFGTYKLVKADVDGKAVEPVVEASGVMLFPIAVPPLGKAILTFTLAFGY